MKYPSVHVKEVTPSMLRTAAYVRRSMNVYSVSMPAPRTALTLSVLTHVAVGLGILWTLMDLAVQV